MNSDEIRAAVLKVLTDAHLASETVIANDSYMSTRFRSNEDAALAAVEALAANGMLPTTTDYRSAYEPDGTPLGYRERQLLTDWQRVTE